jgi:hypothetical protein
LIRHTSDLMQVCLAFFTANTFFTTQAANPPATGVPNLSAVPAFGCPHSAHRAKTEAASTDHRNRLVEMYLAVSE